MESCDPSLLQVVVTGKKVISLVFSGTLNLQLIYEMLSKMSVAKVLRVYTQVDEERKEKLECERPKQSLEEGT